MFMKRVSAPALLATALALVLAVAAPAAYVLNVPVLRVPLAACPPVPSDQPTGGQAASGTLAWAVAGTPNTHTVLAVAAEAPKAPAPEAPKAPDVKAAAAPALDAAKAVESAIEHAADRVGPTVVNILVTRETTAEALEDDDFGFDNPPENLKNFLDRMKNQPRPKMRTQGNGSGSIISADGYILTSEHVIRDALEISVTLSTRKRYPAKVVGADPRRDLAVIHIDAKDLPVATLGDAATLRRGQFVLALGSPFGFGRDGQASLSFGIVSGTRRAIPNIGRLADRYYGNLIQTDAAVNPGNSGGPLVNLDGEIVGVNAVISSQSGSSEGVGFAVPLTAETRRIIERLKKGEEIAYGYLGVEIQEVGEDEAKESGAEQGQGAYVAKVLPDAPGAKAGLKEGDVITQVGEAPVRDPDDVIQAIQSTPVGEKLIVTVLRRGKSRPITVEVARRPAPRDVLAATGGEAGQSWRGLRVETLTPELRTQTGLKETDRGAFVSEVRDRSPAAEAGIVPGMVIDQVGDKKVASIKEFVAAVAAIDGPCMVHVIGLGVKVIQPPAGPKPLAPEKPKDKAPEKAPPEKPAEKSAEKPEPK
jgi:serine protease Do